MPNPNVSELQLSIKYGEDPTLVNGDGQDTNIYRAISSDSDEIDHKYVYQASLGGTYIELAHYASVKQVIIQNMTAFPGTVFYIDNTTGALIPDRLCAPVTGAAQEHISINDPNVTTGIMLYSIAAQEMTDWHLVIVGRKD